MICPWILPAKYIFFTPETSVLVYYSHITSLLISLIILFLIGFSGNKSSSKNFLSILIISFATWVIFNLFLWTSNNSQLIIFLWSFFGLLTCLISIFSYWLYRSFVLEKTNNWKYILFPIITLIPIILITPTKFNLESFDLDICGIAGNANEGNFPYYYYSVAFLFFFLILINFISNFKKLLEKKKQSMIFSLGIIFFMLSFFTASFFASYLAEHGIIQDFGLEQYGLFGMTVFMAIITFIIVRFKTFDIKLIGAQALVWALVIVIGSEFFFVESITNQVLVGVTLIIASILGLILVRSVKKEMAQMEHIEKINIELKKLNDDKSEFVSFASHQIRTPLTSIKGYSANILDGDYGELTPELKDAVQKILVRGTDAVTLISQYLDKSKMELGQLKYDFVDFDIVELAKSVTKGFEPNAEQAKLGLKFNADALSSCLVNADKGKVKEVIGNLIDNAIKYTPSGLIEVSVLKKDGKVLVKFSDTGVGMSKEVIADLYRKFGRAKDAAKTNILGTGLGLFLAKTFMEAMNGRSWAESEGAGKGSQFYIELPVKVEEVKTTVTV